MICLDYITTTPVLPEVLEAMMPYPTSEWGNPSSTYKFGRNMKAVIETVRGQVAELIETYTISLTSLPKLKLEGRGEENLSLTYCRCLYKIRQESIFQRSLL